MLTALTIVGVWLLLVALIMSLFIVAGRADRQWDASVSAALTGRD